MYIFNYKYEFCWHIKNMIDIHKMHEMESFTTHRKVQLSVRESFNWRLRCLSYNDTYSKAYSLFRSSVLQCSVSVIDIKLFESTCRPILFLLFKNSNHGDLKVGN